MGSHGMFVSKLAMFDSRSSMLLSFFMLAERMVMLGLKMMMRGGVRGERPPRDDARAPDALVTVPSPLTPFLGTEPTFAMNSVSPIRVIVTGRISLIKIKTLSH
jgi:hypothetical protein